MGGCCRWSDAALIIFPRPPPLSVWLCGGGGFGGGKGKGERQNAISVISGWARCERVGRKKQDKHRKEEDTAVNSGLRPGLLAR